MLWKKSGSAFPSFCGSLSAGFAYRTAVRLAALPANDCKSLYGAGLDASAGRAKSVGTDGQEIADAGQGKNERVFGRSRRRRERKQRAGSKMRQDALDKMTGNVGKAYAARNVRIGKMLVRLFGWIS